MLQDFQRVEFLKSADITVDIKDGAGAPLTGLVPTDVRVAVLEHDGVVFSGKTVDTSSFQEISGGKYLISFAEAEFNVLGIWIVRVTPDPGYVGTMRPAVKPLEVAEATLDGGLTQDRVSWVPVLLEDSSEAAVGGLTETDLTSIAYRKNNDTTFSALTPTSSNFRELLDLAVPTGIYQVLLSGVILDELGSLDLEVKGPTFEDFSSSYRVVQPSLRPVFIEVIDLESDNLDPVSGATVWATDLSLGEVVGTGTTDALGQVLLDLADGEYRFTLSRGNQIFQENNLLATVVNPNEDYREATAATLLAGNEGPYAFMDGDEIWIRINGGELQKISIDIADFVSPSSISSASAEVLAEILNLKGHSFIASAGGHNYKYLVITSTLLGSSSSVKIEGGSANTELNFNTDEEVGTARSRLINSFQLNGASFVPSFPAPDTDTVEMTYRVVDIEGRPVRNQCVQIVNEFSPAVRASDGITAVLGRKVLQFYTDDNGVLQDPVRGKPRLMKGSVISVTITGTGITRQGIPVPQTDFNLIDRVEQAEDIFTIQKPNLPSAPKF